MSDAQGNGAGVALREPPWEDVPGAGRSHSKLGETTGVTSGRDSASGRDIHLGYLESSQPKGRACQASQQRPIGSPT